MKVRFHTNLDVPSIPFHWNGDDTLDDGIPLPAIGSQMMVEYYGYDVALKVIAHTYRKDKLIPRLL